MSDVFVVNVFSVLLLSYFTHGLDIRAGLAMPRLEVIEDTSFGSLAPALELGLEKARQDGLVPDINFTIIYNGWLLNIRNATTSAMALLDKEDIHVLFGPFSNIATQIIGLAVSYYDTPNILYGPYPLSEFDDHNNFPLTTSLVPNLYKLGIAIIEICHAFNWKNLAFFYTTSSRDLSCSYFASEIEASVSNAKYRAVIALKHRVENGKAAKIIDFLEAVRARARIVLACFDTPLDMRQFMAEIYDEGLANKEFVYITVVTHQYSGSQWNDGLDEKIAEAEKYFIFVSGLKDLEGDKTIEQFRYEFLRKAKMPPFNCANCTDPSRFAYFLHDAAYFYALLLRDAQSEDPEAYKSGTKIMQCKNFTFNGLVGKLRVREHCEIDPVFYGRIVTKNKTKKLMFTIEVHPLGAHFYTLYTAETEMWVNRGGIRPQNKPVCNYDGSGCVDRTYFWWIGAGLAAFVILVAMVIAFLVHREREAERIKSLKLWQIHYASLCKSENHKNAESHRSLQSTGAVSFASSRLVTMNGTTGYELFNYNGHNVLAKRHQIQTNLQNTAHKLLKHMALLKNDNVNKFFGLCTDGDHCWMSIWMYNSRGSLWDILVRQQVVNDAFFKFCLMIDLLKGLHAIHKSNFLKFHGNLTSACCLINERWQVKVSDYGLIHLGIAEENSKLDLLWTAPEVLRGVSFGSKEADMYSYGIICGEIATGQTAFNNTVEEKKAEEIINLVRRGDIPLKRPSLDDVSEDVPPIIIQIIRECWSEKESDRPTTDYLMVLKNSINLSKNKCLMDHMFAMMEDYAENLERDVEMKTNEAIEEKNKADELLYRLLPKQVADSLKRGEVVEPESVEEATLFFSDVVAFAALSAKCSPFQVVMLLNDLYAMFSTIIEKYDIYQVETIGDGSLCASGVPRRNGDAHGREIANMSLSLQERLKSFKILHLPNETVTVRIGIHTGPVVAGVVGLAMPRYCLFGDTVNTASRMESSGKPGMIQLTSSTNHLLTNVLGEFVTELRGEIMVKGKGAMKTYWLLSRANTC